MQIFSAALALLSVAPVMGAGSFSYDPDSDKAPASWASLDIEGNQCGGSAQSGIDVPTHACDVRGDYVFSAGSCTLDDITFTLNDHVIVATYDQTSDCVKPRMQIPGKALPYDALQFHLHTGSDHAIDGRYFGACMHLVHKQVGGTRFSVLGFFLEPTSADGLSKFSDLLAEWENVESEVAADCAVVNVTTNVTSQQDLNVTTNVTSQQDLNVTTNVTSQQGGGRKLEANKATNQDHRALPRSFNPYELIPAGATMYTYDGSLTTPPCSEVVDWNVVEIPVSIGVREFLRLTNLILDYVSPDNCEPSTEAAPSGFTGRPVQAINGREIKRICPVNFEDKLAEKEKEDESTPAASPTTDEDSSAFSSSVIVALALSAVAALL